MKTGVFTTSDIKGLIQSGRVVTLSGYKESHVGPASLDLTVSKNYVYEVTNLLKPSGHRREKVRDLVNATRTGMVHLGEVLWPGKTYLAKASIDVNFPPGMYAYANAKSTSGRNFLLVRLLADECEGFDTIDHRRRGYTGEVWFVIQPLAYPVVLTNEEAYIQIRFFDGDTRFNEYDLQRLLQTTNLLFTSSGYPYQQGELSLFAEDGSVFTTLYAKAGKIVGFRALSSKVPLDLSSRGIDPREYFEPIIAREDPCDIQGGLIDLYPSQLLLLSTNEKFNVPDWLSSELRALDPRLGLFFSHFAGFFDPGFFGTPTLEVATFTPTTLRHKEVVARFTLERMRGATVSYAQQGNYSGQSRTTLPKQFAMPDEWRIGME